MSTFPVLFHDLTPDMILAILCLLEPVDIINVRKTCNALHSTTLRRIIWLQALGNLVQEHDIYAHTYDVDSMSNAQLERAVMFPTRLLELSKKEGDQFLMPKLHRVFTNIAHQDEKVAAMAIPAHHRPWGVNRVWDFSEMLMVPGGRFLLTTSEPREKSCVKMWDLGAPGSGDAEIRHLSTMSLPGHVSIYDTAPTPDGLGIVTVVALESKTDEQTYRINVYHIFPLSPTPTFIEVGTVRILQNVRSIVISANRIFSVTKSMGDPNEGGHILIWDYVNNMSTTLFIVSSIPLDVYPYGDHLVTCHHNVLSMWAIPPLEAKPPVYGDVPTDALWTQLISPRSLISTTDYRSMPHQLSWKHGSRETHSFYVCNTVGQPADIVGFAIDRSWIPLDSDVSSDAHPAVNPSVLAKFEYRLLTHGNNFSQNPPQKCNQAIVASCAQEDDIMLLFTPTPGESTASPSAITSPQKCFLRVRKFRSAYAHFCAATGRACALGTNGEIRILDYVA